MARDQDFRDVFARAAQETEQSPEDMAEITERNAEISGLEQTIAGVYPQIGELYYKKHAADCREPELFVLVQKVTGCLEEIEACREQIRQIKGLILCEFCGEEVSKRSAFCCCCGKRLIPELPAGTLVCPKCGAAVKEGQKFCMVCGERLGDGKVVVTAKKRCRGCGAQMDADALFCSKCGKKVKLSKEPEERAAGLPKDPEPVPVQSDAARAYRKPESEPAGGSPAAENGGPQEEIGWRSSFFGSFRAKADEDAGFSSFRELTEERKPEAEKDTGSEEGAPEEDASERAAHGNFPDERMRKAGFALDTEEPEEVEEDAQPTEVDGGKEQEVEPTELLRETVPVTGALKEQIPVPEPETAEEPEVPSAVADLGAEPEPGSAGENTETAGVAQKEAETVLFGKSEELTEEDAPAAETQDAFSFTEEEEEPAHSEEMGGGFSLSPEEFEGKAEETEEDEILFCTECGSKLVEHAHFCMICGYRVR